MTYPTKSGTTAVRAVVTCHCGHDIETMVRKSGGDPGVSVRCGQCGQINWTRQLKPRDSDCPEDETSTTTNLICRPDWMVSPTEAIWFGGEFGE